MDMSAQNPWLIEPGDLEDQLGLLRELPEMNYFHDITHDQEIAALLGVGAATNQGANLINSHHPSHQCGSPSTDSTATTLTSSACPTTSRPSKQARRLVQHSSPCLPVILNFGSASSMPDGDNDIHYNPGNIESRRRQEEVQPEKRRSFLKNNGSCVRKPEPISTTPAKRKSSSMVKPATTAPRDHILAERRRREKITQHLIALSALLPDLKRMDKSSVLGEAVKHIKELQERVKTLEEDHTRKTMEAAILVKKSQVTFEEDDLSSSGDNEEDKGQGHDHNHDHEDQMFGIEVKVWNNNLLIKLQCERREAILLNLINAVEKYKLQLSSVHATPFGDRTFDITIIAKMDEEIKVQNVVGDLSSVVRGV